MSVHVLWCFVPIGKCVRGGGGGVRVCNDLCCYSERGSRKGSKTSAMLVSCLPIIGTCAGGVGGMGPRVVREHTHHTRLIRVYHFAHNKAYVPHSACEKECAVCG